MRILKAHADDHLPPGEVEIVLRLHASEKGELIVRADSDMHEASLVPAAINLAYLLRVALELSEQQFQTLKTIAELAYPEKAAEAVDDDAAEAAKEAQ